MSSKFIPTVRLQMGTVVADPSNAENYVVNVSGVYLPAIWNMGYIPAIGDNVRVLLVDGMALVVAAAGYDRRPLLGIVAGSASNGRVPVTTFAGTFYARFIGTAPTIGNQVRFDWAATEPWIWPVSASPSTPSTDAPPPPSPTNPSAPKPPPPPPPEKPKPPQTGMMTVSAINSGSYQVGGNWAFMGKTVMQWRWSGARENRGAWFYGSKPQQLRGRTITRIQIRLPARRRIGNYNQSATAHIYRHTSKSRPSGDVNRVQGPHNVSIPANARARWVDLPVSFGRNLVSSGGGFGLQGSPYLGFGGIDDDPASGQLRIYWRR